MIGDLKKMRIKGDYRLIKMKAACKKNGEQQHNKHFEAKQTLN